MGGCRLIISDCYALPEIIGDSGYIVKENIIDETVKVIKKILSFDRNKFNSKVLPKFSIEERKKRFMKIL